MKLYLNIKMKAKAGLGLDLIWVERTHKESAKLYRFFLYVYLCQDLSSHEWYNIRGKIAMKRCGEEYQFAIYKKSIPIFLLIGKYWTTKILPFFFSCVHPIIQELMIGRAKFLKTLSCTIRVFIWNIECILVLGMKPSCYFT